MTAPLEDYALIGDGRTAALVRRDGSIDWLCWPRFDSDACFAALLGGDDHGHWLITPAEPPAGIRRRYQSDTLILETDFETATGAIRLIDFMPVNARDPALIRIVIGLRGSQRVRLALGLRFDYGRIMPWIEAGPDGFSARVGPDLLIFQAPVPIQADSSGAGAEFTIEAGQRLAFCLVSGSALGPPPALPDIEQALHHTSAYWRGWIDQFSRPVPWADAVRRSLLTLKALIYQPTGALVAAPTTSLPERPGGAANWDYRYCWLRDSTFALTALLNAGFHAEAQSWRDWILSTLGAEPAKLRILYQVDGGRSPGERTIDWLPGYRWATPVRIGNAAADQHQVDVYGELLDLLELATRAGLPQSEQGRHAERQLAQHLEQVWCTPGQGLWESRGTPRHYTYSRVMAWAGLDRFVRSAMRYGHADGPMLDRLRALGTRIHAEVCSEGYHTGLGTFVQHYGGQDLDASLLLLPLVGFMPARDPRMERTIDAIERQLMRDGLVLRTRPTGSNPQGAFIACTCWLADCRRMQGRDQEAREALERVLAIGNDVGLLSEEYDLEGRHLSGNFPQALSHLAVVNTALGLAGPVLQRGGGIHLSFLDPQGPIAALQRVHFYEVLAVLVVLVALPIFVLTPWFAWRYRYGATGVRYTPKWDQSWLIEIAAWTGPVAIVGGLAFFLWRDSHQVDPYRPLVSVEPALPIQVVGYDWKWLFIYPEQGIATVGVLTIPVGRPLAMQLTSATVMQSLMIPALGSQIYAMGGMVTQLHLEATRSGRLLGENTMFNGRGFQQQRFTAVALPAADFAAWVRSVRAHGMPLRESALRALAQEGSRADLIAALPRASTAGAVEFTDVPAGFFTMLVNATMNGVPAYLPGIAADGGAAHRLSAQRP